MAPRNDTNRPLRAALYLRISDDREGREAGVERQEEDTRKDAETKGYTLVTNPVTGRDVFVDNDRSASNRRVVREQFETMIDLVRAGEIDVIVAWRIDRLYRQPIELEVLLELVEDRRALRGGIVTVTSGKFELNTPAGRNYARGMVAHAKMEAENTSDRVRRAILQSAERGRPRGGKRGVGYRRPREGEPRSPGLIVVPEEEALLRRAATLLLDDGRSLHSICSMFNEEGHRTPSAGKKRKDGSVAAGEWTTTTLRNALIKPEVAGLRTYTVEDDSGHEDRKMVRGDWAPILDEEQWHRVRALLMDPARRTLDGQGDRGSLSGMLTCGSCGKPLVQRQVQPRDRKKARRLVYACPTGKVNRQQGFCGGVSIPRHWVEEIVVDELAGVGSDHLDRIAAHGRSSAETEELAGLAAEREGIERRAAAAGIRLADEDNPTRRIAIDAEIDALAAKAETNRRRAAQIAKLPAPVNSHRLRRDLAGLHAKPAREQRKIIEKTVETVVVSPATVRGGNTSDRDAMYRRMADRITVVWKHERTAAA
jgi:DNA invertase Pin-like site-specific DNA recombinase